MGHKKQLSSHEFYDEKSSVRWMIYGSNQWISWDDAQSFEAKKKFMFSRCLKGLMIWELGLDTADFQALTGLFGEDAVGNALRDTSLNPGEKDQLARDLAAFTGQNCYVTLSCTKGGRSAGSPSGVCGPGYSSVEVAHNPTQMNRHPERGSPEVCSDGQYHHICCPTEAQPRNCGWEVC
jgi:hypothetical protein